MSLESEIKKLTEAITALTEVTKQISMPTVSVDTAQSAKETESPVSEAAAASVADIFGTDEVKDTTPPKATIEDVKTALKAYMDKNGEKKTIELLGKFNANKITELKEEDYAKLVSAAAA